MVSMIRQFASIVIAVAFIGGVVLAQTATSRITGTVTDATGALVPGAMVTAKNEGTGVTYAQTTTEAGLYGFPSLPVGPYTITVALPGFKTASKTGNILVVDTTLVINMSLEVGGVTETVSIAAESEALQLTNASIGNVVEHKAIVDLPLNGRNPLALIALEPGVVQRSAGATGSGLHVNGARDRAVNVTVDGIEANESSVPNPVSNLYRLNPDNTQEYKVTTSNATPEEGRNSGASVSVATRAGTNEFHGTLFEFVRNTALNANEFFANAQGSTKPDIKMHQFGVEAGGPIRKNKTFFFGSWQGQNTKFAQPIDQTFGTPRLYTPSALAGIFRYFVSDPANPLVLNGQRITRNAPLLVDPATGAYRPGIRDCAGPSELNCVRSFNMFANDPLQIGADPKMAALFKTYPQPNSYIVGDGLNTAGYVWNPPTRNEGPNFMARVDHTFNDRNTLFVRWLQADQDTRAGDPLNARPQVFPGFPPLGEVFRATKNLAISDRWTISPRIVNEFTAGFARFVFLFTQGEANPAFPDVLPFNTNSTPGGTANAFNNASFPYINTPRTFRAVTTPQFLDNLSILTGAHVFRMGANVRFYEHNDQRGQPGGTNVTPLLTFAQSLRTPAGFNTPSVGAGSIDSTDSNNLNGAINDILGIPARLSQVFLGDLSADAFLPFRSGNSVTLWNLGHRLKQYNFYFQDEWRLRPNVTVNYGVRWEINPAPTEAADRVYVPDRPLVGAGLVTFRKSKRWYERNNVGAIAPRLGIAWSPRPNFVIRSGYGIAFDPISSFQVTAVSGKVPGLTYSCSATPGGTPTQGCASVPDIRIDRGFPLELPPPTAKPSSFLTPPEQTLTNAPNLTVFDQKLKLPTVHQWNLTIEHELPGGVVAQVSYIGRRGTRLLRAYDLNQINADPILPSFLIMQQNVKNGCMADGTAAAGSGCTNGVPVPLVTAGIVNSAFVTNSAAQTDVAQNAAGNFAGRIEQQTTAAKIRPNQQFATITYIDSGGDSYYHSGQATVRKRFANGLQAGVAYTYGKSIDDQSVDPVGATSGGALTPTTSRNPIDTRNWRNERSRSDFDRRHVLTINSLWELPVGKQKHFASGIPSALNHVIGGWSLNGIYTFMSGEPFSVRSGARTSNFSHDSRADIIGSKPEVRLQEVSGIIGPVVFKDNSAFALPAPGSNGAGRNIFEAPSYWNLDLGIGKRFDLGERLNLQFRAEMFNALNHPNFDNPRDASSGSNSILSNLFGQTCCQTVAPPTTQTIIQTGEAGRVIQFALKMLW